MAEKSHGQESPQAGPERSKRDILRATKEAWTPLDEQLPPPLQEDSKQESIQQWLDFGFFIPVHENLQQIIDHTVSLQEQGMVPVTVRDYMRSLHHFSETPSLSRGTSLNSCYSAASIPQSIPEWLEFWEEDPVEILLDLGFGIDEPDICTQIPARFLGCVSAARGINIRVFLKAQKQRMDIENPSLYGRFQQVKLLDHVASAFSSLLNDVNILPNKTEEKAGEKSRQRASASGAQENQKRVGELFRRASKQSLRLDCSPEAPKSSRMQSTSSITSAKPAECGVMLSASTNDCDQSHLSPSMEGMSQPTKDTSLPCHPPRALLSKQWPHSSKLAKQALHSCMSDGPVTDRTRKENLFQTCKMKNLPGYGDSAQDSFEMEEVQSFEEEAGNSLDRTSGTVGATVNRTNSCQSDSSGFLEEPAEQPGLQVHSLSYSHSTAKNDYSKHSDQGPSCQSAQQESDESDAKSMVSTSFSSQDWSFLEEKASASVVEKDSPWEATKGPPEPSTPDMAADTLRESLGTDTPVQPLSAVAQTEEVLVGIATSESVCPPEVKRTHTAGAGEELLLPEHSQHCESQRHPETNHPGDKCLHVGSEVPPGVGSGPFCPGTISLPPTREDPPQPACKLGAAAAPSTPDLRRTAAKSLSCPDTPTARTPPAKPMCEASGQTPPRAEEEVENLSPNAGSGVGSSQSVTIRTPCSLATDAHRVMALETDSRGAAWECTITTAGPVLGTKAKQVKDAWVQTHLCEPWLWHYGPAPSSKSLSHTAQPLTKSVSLDTGLSSISSMGTSPATPAHSCFCCHHHPHRHSERASPHTVSSACRHWPCPHTHHPEEQLMKTLGALQAATVRQLCSCTVREVETMKRVCQSFREHLEEIEQHLVGQQALLSGDMSEEEREEAEQLQALREALREQVEELEFQLGDRARQIREGILLPFKLLSEDTPKLSANLRQYDWTEEKRDLTLCPQTHTVMTGQASEDQRAPCSEVTHPAAISPPT
ncbi:protein ITPRID1 [Erinaceus europaeus]|uniref:Protein ITPRID1 n=1 Tax=Erinaceus europaeus TaxID=9365 RepID=A0A1S3WLY6_ERIEU|nr:protein ITPRID1 [Erinaceus europaeus]